MVDGKAKKWLGQPDRMRREELAGSEEQKGKYREV